MDGDCPICMDSINLEDKHDGIILAECTKCGTFKFSAKNKLFLKELSEEKKITLSHWIRSNYLKSKETVHLPDLESDSIFYNNLRQLCTVEKINNLIEYSGDNSTEIGSVIELNILDLQAIIGIVNKEGLEIIIDYFTDNKLARIIEKENNYKITLLIEGWLKYENQKRLCK